MRHLEARARFLWGCWGILPGVNNPLIYVEGVPRMVATDTANAGSDWLAKTAREI